MYDLQREQEVGTGAKLKNVAKTIMRKQVLFDENEEEIDLAKITHCQECMYAEA